MLRRGRMTDQVLQRRFYRREFDFQSLRLSLRFLNHVGGLANQFLAEAPR